MVDCSSTARMQRFINYLIHRSTFGIEVAAIHDHNASTDVGNIVYAVKVPEPKYVLSKTGSPDAIIDVILSAVSLAAIVGSQVSRCSLTLIASNIQFGLSAPSH